MNKKPSPEEERFLYGSGTSLLMVAIISAVIADLLSSSFIGFIFIWLVLLLIAGSIRQLYVKNKIEKIKKG